MTPLRASTQLTVISMTLKSATVGSMQYLNSILKHLSFAFQILHNEEVDAILASNIVQRTNVRMA